MLKYALDFVSDILVFGLCFYFFRAMYSLKKTKPIILFSAAGCVFLKILISFLQIPFLNTVSSIVLLLIFINLLFRFESKTYLVYFFFFYVSMFISEICQTVIFSVLNRITLEKILEDNIYLIQRNVLIWILSICITNIFKLLFVKRKIGHVRVHEILFYTYLVLFELIVFMIFEYFSKSKSSGWVSLIIILGFLVIDIYLIFIFYDKEKLLKNEYSFQLMKQQEKYYLEMYQRMERKYEESASFAHDVNKHIRTLEGLISDRTDDKTIEYLHKMQKSVQCFRPAIKSRNKVLDVILNSMFEECESQNIELFLDINSVSIDFMENIDITTIFVNLLENAKTACMMFPCEQRRISLVMKEKMGYVFFRIQNPCAMNSETDFDFKCYGIGLNNVSKALEYYEGVMSISTKDSLFEVSVSIPIPQSE